MGKGGTSIQGAEDPVPRQKNLVWNTVLHCRYTIYTLLTTVLHCLLWLSSSASASIHLFYGLEPI
jgi:hypothetical protein